MGAFAFFEASSISYGAGDDVGHDELRVLAVGDSALGKNGDCSLWGLDGAVVSLGFAVREERLDEEFGGVADVLGLEEFLCGVVFLPAG